MANNEEYIDESYVATFLSASIFGRSYHSRYQNFEFTDSCTPYSILACAQACTVAGYTATSGGCSIVIKYNMYIITNDDNTAAD